LVTPSEMGTAPWVTVWGVGAEAGSWARVGATGEPARTPARMDASSGRRKDVIIDSS